MSKIRIDANKPNRETISAEKPPKTFSTEKPPRSFEQAGPSIRHSRSSRSIPVDHHDSVRLHGEEDDHDEDGSDTDEPESSSSSGHTAVDDTTPGQLEAGPRQRRVPTSQIPAAERDWPEDIVSFDSRQDRENPKNWPIRHKYAVTMMFGLTTSAYFLRLKRTTSLNTFAVCSTFASSVFSAASRAVG